MLGFIFISFIAGVLTVLAPCILPLLPVIVGGSLSGKTSTRRVFVIVLSLGLSVFLFTLILKFSTTFITIPSIFWQLLSGVLLIFFGLVTLLPELWDRIPAISALYAKSNKILGAGYQKQNIFGDVIVGAALGPVFSSCSPTYFVILAAVLPAHFTVGLVYLISYIIGLCLFLFVIAYLGQKAITRIGVASDPKSWFKKTIGVIFIIVGIAVIFGLDKKLEAALPSGAFGEIGIEQRLLSSGQNNKASIYSKAPDLVSPDGFINTDGNPISLSQYVGKDVVLIDFWDYSCINCQRTIPYLNAWYQKYKDQGLVIIGVHTPEFSFEHQLSNVQSAVNQFGIKYPVVLDNEYQTWNAYQNEYWPNEYLVDIDGYVVHNQAGEGNYDETEQAIQKALAERATRLGISTPVATSTVVIPAANLSEIQSPETYFGSDRNQGLGNLSLHLGGSWNIMPEYAEGGVGNSILFQYNADDVYIVAANNGVPVKIKVFRDGKPVGSFAGADVDSNTSETTINGDRLYKLIHDSTPGIHTIEIQIESGTLDAYTFTFG